MKTTITVHADLGPSSAKRFLLDWHIACAERNWDFVTQRITDDVSLELVGDKTVHGKAAVMEALNARWETPTTELVVREIITHGREGAVNGEIRRDRDRSEAFCEVYAFKNTKADTIRSIASYVVPL